MRPLFTSIMALTMALPTAARADWAYTRWGMTPEQVAQAGRGAVTVIPTAKQRRLDEINLVNAAEGSFTDGKLQLRVNFSFDTRTGGLACVGYVVKDTAQSPLLRDWLIARHGKPERVSGLAAIGMESMSWSEPDEINLDLVKGEPAYVLHCAREQNEGSIDSAEKIRK